MKRSKKTVLIVLCVVLLTVGIGALCIGLQVVPTVNHTLRISELLQPVIDANNQTMHLATSAGFDGRMLTTESDVYLVTEDGTDYFVLEQNGNAVYISDNVLFLENGKAFKMGDKLQKQTASYEDLLVHIGVLYETLKITAEETESQCIYSVTVTGEQAKTLLEAASFGEALPVEGVEKLKLQLTEKNGKLDQISFSGSGNADKTAVMLHATLSGFRILSAGDYPIPDAVKQAAATVDPEVLFSLTEDLYRLVLALAPFADMESIEGTLALTVDCGPLQLDTQMNLADLKTASNGQLDPEALQKLPEILGLMCMEGETRCTADSNGYLYTLELDQVSMQQLTRIILPELTKYSQNLTNGMVSILLEDGNVTAMKVSIDGKVPMLFTQVPILVSAVFHFL